MAVKHTVGYSNPPTMFVGGRAGGCQIFPLSICGRWGGPMYGSRMPYDPGDAMGVLIYAACVMLGPEPAIFGCSTVKSRVFPDDTSN